MKKNKLVLASLLSSVILGFSVSGCAPQDSATSQSQTTMTQQSISTLVNKEFPMIPVNSMSIEFNKDIKLWQVYALGQVMYITQDGKYFIGGHYFKFGDSQKDLTQEYIDEKNIIDVKSLPLDLAIKTVKGNGKNILYVFSDPECPYCHMLQSEVVNKLDNSTIYTFLYPLPMHQNAASDSAKILCEKDPDATFQKWMTISPEKQASAHDSYFKNMTECQDGKEKVSKLLKLGQTLNINGTPTIITVNGRKVTPQDLVKMSQQADGVSSHTDSSRPEAGHAVSSSPVESK